MKSNRVASQRQLEELRQRILTAGSAYDILAVPAGATDEQLREARRLLQRAFHPDRCVLPDATHIMAVVNVAFDTLSDPKQRKSYDTINRTKDSSCARCDGAGFIFKQKGFKSKVKVACPICGGTGHA